MADSVRLLLVLLLAQVAVVACNTSPGAPAATTSAAPAATATVTPVPAPTGTSAMGGEAVPSPAVMPVAVDYLTPAQQEGPYYPVEKPADRDNDLVAFAAADGSPAGEVLSLAGVVYDAGGLPLEGVTVEIWQTDSSGVYDHPGDPGTEQRDRNFQFYGESVTGADGVYSFWTIVPGRYEPRPRHIHVKVKRGGNTLLTTQFYFADEVSFEGPEAHLLIERAPAEDDAGNPIWVGERDIVLDLGE